jgi:hypothetical protein
VFKVAGQTQTILSLWSVATIAHRQWKAGNMHADNADAQTKPSAFVLSPIDPEFDEVYSQLIRPALEQEGFQVARADELDLQNIMAAIMHGIQSADLIIAEITTRNPNVMYELGIAHALEKPVAMLTQDIDQVPFDLRSYRVIKYSPHFASVGTLTTTLREIAKATVAGTLSHSSPVADFSEQTTESAISPGPATDTADEPAGLLDHLEKNQDLLSQLRTGTTTVGEATQDIGERFTERTAELELISGAGTSGHSAKALTVLRRTAKDLDGYVSQLEAYDRLLKDLVPEISESLIGAVRLTPIVDTNDRDAAESLVQSLKGLRTGLGGGAEGIASMRDILAGLRDQKMSRDFSRSARKAVLVMDSILDGLSSFESDIVRGTSVISERLDEGDATGDSRGS